MQCLKEIQETHALLTYENRDQVAEGSVGPEVQWAPPQGSQFLYLRMRNYTEIY